MHRFWRFEWASRARRIKVLRSPVWEYGVGISGAAKDSGIRGRLHYIKNNYTRLFPLDYTKP